ncbi:MAG: metallophosphoesterase [Phycisphaerae bacterium]
MKAIRRIVYLTDVHLGGDDQMWSQQPACPQLVPQLLTDLREWIACNHMDLVLCGGDLIHNGTRIQQEQAYNILSSFPASVRLCLGNHDLALPDSLANWFQYCPELWGSQGTATGDVVLDIGSALLIIVTNCWHGYGPDPSFYCPGDGKVWAGLIEKQYAWLEKQLKQSQNKPVILAMHATLYPLPTTLTAAPFPIHGPEGPYAEKMAQFVVEHPQIKLVLSGHCHATCRTYQNGCVHLTTSAFVEPPFQVRTITITENAFDVTTTCFVDIEAYTPSINRQKLWTAGGWSDWCIHIPF